MPQLGRPYRLTGEELPGAPLLEPDLQDEDPRAGGLAIHFALGRPLVSRDRVVADDRDRVIRQRERLDYPTTTTQYLINL
jgi:hypothetical protein